MDIKIDERFILKQSFGDRFDIVEMVTRTKKDSEETYKAEQIIAYDTRLENAISRVVLEKLREKEKTVTLNEFLNEYKKEKELLTKQINLV